MAILEEVSDEIIKRRKELLKRPTWEEYYVTMAHIVAQRSFDPSSKCGCVLVSKDNRVLSTGYNGPLKGSVDEEIPLTRPEKYCHMIHSEENSLLAYGGSHKDIQGATAYITGPPCHRCLRMMLQKGITKLVYAEQNIKCVDEDDKKAQEIMLRHRDIIIKIIPNEKIVELLNQTIDYMPQKEKEK